MLKQKITKSKIIAIIAILLAIRNVRTTGENRGGSTCQSFLFKDETSGKPVNSREPFFLAPLLDRFKHRTIPEKVKDLPGHVPLVELLVFAEALRRMGEVSFDNGNISQKSQKMFNEKFTELLRKYQLDPNTMQNHVESGFRLFCAMPNISAFDLIHYLNRFLKDTDFTFRVNLHERELSLSTLVSKEELLEHFVGFCIPDEIGALPEDLPIYYLLMYASSLSRLKIDSTYPNEHRPAFDEIMAKELPSSEDYPMLRGQQKEALSMLFTVMPNSPARLLNNFAMNFLEKQNGQEPKVAPQGQKSGATGVEKENPLENLTKFLSQSKLSFKLGKGEDPVTATPGKLEKLKEIGVSLEDVLRWLGAKWSAWIEVHRMNLKSKDEPKRPSPETLRVHLNNDDEWLKVKAIEELLGLPKPPTDSSIKQDMDPIEKRNHLNTLNARIINMIEEEMRHLQKYMKTIEASQGSQRTPNPIAGVVHKSHLESLFKKTFQFDGDISTIMLEYWVRITELGLKKNIFNFEHAFSCCLQNITPLSRQMLSDKKEGLSHLDQLFNGVAGLEKVKDFLKEVNSNPAKFTYALDSDLKRAQTVPDPGEKGLPQFSQMHQNVILGLRLSTVARLLGGDYQNRNPAADLKIPIVAVIAWLHAKVAAMEEYGCECSCIDKVLLEQFFMVHPNKYAEVILQLETLKIEMTYTVGELLLLAQLMKEIQQNLPQAVENQHLKKGSYVIDKRTFLLESGLVPTSDFYELPEDLGIPELIAWLEARAQASNHLDFLERIVREKFEHFLSILILNTGFKDSRENFDKALSRLKEMTLNQLKDQLPFVEVAAKPEQPKSSEMPLEMKDQLPFVEVAAKPEQSKSSEMPFVIPIKEIIDVFYDHGIELPQEFSKVIPVVEVDTVISFLEHMAAFKPEIRKDKDGFPALFENRIRMIYPGNPSKQEDILALFEGIGLPEEQETIEKLIKIFIELRKKMESSFREQIEVIPPKPSVDDIIRQCPNGFVPAECLSKLVPGFTGLDRLPEESAYLPEDLLFTLFGHLRGLDIHCPEGCEKILKDIIKEVKRDVKIQTAFLVALKKFYELYRKVQGSKSELTKLFEDIMKGKEPPEKKNIVDLMRPPVEKEMAEFSKECMKHAEFLEGTKVSLPELLAVLNTNPLKASTLPVEGQIKTEKYLERQEIAEFLKDLDEEGFQHKGEEQSEQKKILAAITSLPGLQKVMKDYLRAVSKKLAENMARDIIGNAGEADPDSDKEDQPAPATDDEVDPTSQSYDPCAKIKEID